MRNSLRRGIICGVIHLDANGSTGLLPEVLDAMLPWLRGDHGHANPSGAYAGGRAARAAIDQARAEVAALIGAEADEIIFTSGGTESAQLALHSMDRLVDQGACVVSAIEHAAVLRGAEQLGRPMTAAPVTAEGRLDLAAYEALLEDAAMVSVMAANNETGVMQPLQEAARMAAERGLPVHSDAVQMAGKATLEVRQLGVDFLSLSAHKFHGPKGVGALYTKRGLRFFPQQHGGGQEGGRRAGTENVAGIVGMGMAARMLRDNRSAGEAMRVMRDRFEAKLLSDLQGVRVNGDQTHRLPNTSHLSFAGCEAVELIRSLDQAGLECSAASACLSGKIRPSHVQLAMGFDNARGRSSLRFSFSRLNTEAEAWQAAEIVADCVRKQRQAPRSGPSCSLS